MRGVFDGWRGLGWFWGLVVLACASVAGTLALMGPPGPPLPAHAPVVAPTPAPHAVARPEGHDPASPTVAARGNKPGRDVPGPVNDPDPALLEYIAGSTTDALPRVAGDGRLPMRHYATGFDPTTTRPRVGLLIAGFGLGVADSKRAIANLPREVTFAISPYTDNPEPLLASARLAGHEYVLSLPMEPLRFPENDPGPRALMTNLSAQQNQPRLRWVLSRLQGYAGVTAVLGALKGERLADMPEQMESIMAELDRRGLMYVPALGQAAPVPHVWSKAVDIVIDESAAATDIDSRLAGLETMARERGSALGLAVSPRPVTVERVAEWTSALLNRGLILAPVSALMLPPEDKPK